MISWHVFSFICVLLLGSAWACGDHEFVQLRAVEDDNAAFKVPGAADLAASLSRHPRSPSMACPVCNTAVSLSSPYVEIPALAGDSQRIYTCSLAHAQALKAHPLKYKDQDAEKVESASGLEWTYIEPTKECPFCKMDVVMEHRLVLNGNQTLYACEMPPHFTLLTTNETALSARMIAVDPSSSGKGTISCPVCGKELDENMPFVSIRNGQQKIYACSNEHAQLLLEQPLSYTLELANITEESYDTPVLPVRQCPFCNMDAVKAHGLNFKGGQAVYACVMESHFRELGQETALKSAFSGIENNGEVTSEEKKYCWGSGTVMLNGLTMSTDICVTYLFEAAVLNEMWKFIVACIGTLLLGFLTQTVHFVRAEALRRQKVTRLQEKRSPTIGELVFNSFLFFVTAVLGYALMLVVMTYSGYIFICTIVGLTLGHFVSSLYLRHAFVPEVEASKTVCGCC